MQALETTEPTAQAATIVDGHVITLAEGHSFYIDSHGHVYLDVFGEAPIKIVVGDGVAYDGDTGEQIGGAIPVETAADNDGLATWVMSKMLRHDSRRISAQRANDVATTQVKALMQKAMEALDLTPEMIELRAIQDNSAKIVLDSQRSLDFFHAAYDRRLGDWAAMNLGTSKSKTWTTIYGSVSLKATPAKLTVTDAEKALDAANGQAWSDAIKTVTTFLISGVPKDEKAKLIADPTMAHAYGFTVEPAGETVTVKTNAGA